MRPSLADVLRQALQDQGLTMKEWFDRQNCGIYQIRNVKDGKCYIGSSIKIQDRLGRHFRRLCKGKHPNPYLQNAWNKHGAQSFRVGLVEAVPHEELIGREQEYLDAYRPEYNLSPTAGTNRGWRMTEEHSRRHSQRIRREWAEGIRKSTLTQRAAAREVGLANQGRKHGPHSKDRRRLHSGERHHAAKLTENDVVQIRLLLQEGKLRHKEIAAMFGVGRNAITSINCGKSWRLWAGGEESEPCQP